MLYLTPARLLVWSNCNKPPSDLPPKEALVTPRQLLSMLPPVLLMMMTVLRKVWIPHLLMYALLLLLIPLFEFRADKVHRICPNSLQSPQQKEMSATAATPVFLLEMAAAAAVTAQGVGLYLTAVLLLDSLVYCCAAALMLPLPSRDQPSAVHPHQGHPGSCGRQGKVSLCTSTPPPKN